MKRSRHKSASSVAINEETHQDNNTFWSEYWYYFPRIEVSPFSVSGAAITFLIMALTTVIYTIVYVIYMSLTMLVRSIRR